MKKLLLTGLFCILSSFSFAQEANNIILDLDANEKEASPIKLEQFVNTVWEVGEYFHTNYPDKLIDTNLKPDIKKFFPDSNHEELRSKEKLIRNCIKIFRWGKEKYNQIKSSLLVPDEPILTYKDSEYENPDDYTYQDAGPNNVLIVTDIKKVISYSHDKKERKNYEHYMNKKNNLEKLEKTFPQVAKLWKTYEKIELKKLPFYGIIYDDPLTDKEGISDWVKQEHAQIRLGFENSHLNDSKEIRGVVHFQIDNNSVILADKYNTFPEININFDGSTNIENCALFAPLPNRIYIGDENLIIYNNTLGYPFICNIQDTSQTAHIKSNIKYTLCDNQKQCNIYNTTIEDDLKPGNGFSTMMKNFIVQTFNSLPKQEEDDITIQDVSIIKDTSSPTGECLRVIIDSNVNIKSPELYIKSKNVQFGAPKTAIDGDRISIRFDILNKDHNLTSQEIELTFTPNKIKSYRLHKRPQSSSIFDINSQQLNLGLILLAFLGGIILNFMPCVFPVLSLKFLALTKFGAKKSQNVKQNFLLSAIGILTGFFLISIILSILKYIGHNLGWGIQFQNPVFLLAMIYIIILFISQIQGIINFTLPFIDKITKKEYSPALNSFLSGFLIVLMATPCTGPYLGTTIGFALSGTTIDIFAILMSVALGLSLPYLLLGLIPTLSYIIPSPGAWMYKIHKLMQIMLFLTIIWLLSILKAQTSWLTIIITCVLALLFYFLVYVYYQSKLETEKEYRKDKTNLNKMKKILYYVFTIILCILFIINVIIGKYELKKHQTVVEKNTQTAIDFNQISEYVSQGYNVIVRIGADWCLTCSYNNFLVFDNVTTKPMYENYNIKFININWTSYNPEILNFMSEYGRRGLPFYVLYNKHIPEGLVLPEILSQMKFENIIFNNAIQEDINKHELKE